MSIFIMANDLSINLNLGFFWQEQAHCIEMIPGQHLPFVKDSFWWTEMWNSYKPQIELFGEFDIYIHKINA